MLSIPQLRGDEELAARHAALADTFAHALLIAVSRGSIYMSIPGQNRLAHRIARNVAIRRLPCTKANARDPNAVSQRIAVL